MKTILCKIFSFLKYILLIAAFGLVLFGIISTYARLDKPLTESFGVFIPFAIVLITYIINIIVRSKHVSNSLLFNFVSVAVFVLAIIICLRSMFDTNMILFYKYGINYNPSFFADNLSAICTMVYMIGFSNIILLICDFIDRDKKKVKVEKAEEKENEIEKLE